jgi:toxin ParE1/3/4
MASMYDLSKAAANDIDAILEHTIINFGAVQSKRYFLSIKRCLELLGDNPNMGTDATDVRSGYRRFSHQSHVVFYLQTGKKAIRIVRVLHKSMDIDAAL